MSDLRIRNVRGPNRMIGTPDFLRVGTDIPNNSAARSRVNAALGSSAGGGDGGGGFTMIGFAAAGR